MSGSKRETALICYRDYSQGPNHHTDDFVVIADPVMVKAWRKDPSIPLVDVLDSWDIFTTYSGSKTGKLVKSSNQSLANVFGSDLDKLEIVKKILVDGRMLPRSSGF